VLLSTRPLFHLMSSRENRIAQVISALLGNSSHSGMSSSNRGGQGKGRQGRKVQSRPVSSGLGGFASSNMQDLKVKPPSLTNVPTSVPRNVAALMAWDTVKINGAITTGATLTETNFVGVLSYHPQSAYWQALFDQYSIPRFTVEFDSLLPPGYVANPPMFYSALDFDNQSPLGSIGAIEDYATCEAVPMTAGRRVMRSVRPSCKESIQSNGLTASLSGCGPIWVDAGRNDVQFFGIRTMLGPTPGSPVVLVNYTITIWFVFRNQI